MNSIKYDFRMEVFQFNKLLNNLKKENRTSLTRHNEETCRIAIAKCKNMQ